MSGLQELHASAPRSDIATPKPHLFSAVHLSVTQENCRSVVILADNQTPYVVVELQQYKKGGRGGH